MLETYALTCACIWIFSHPLTTMSVRQLIERIKYLRLCNYVRRGIQRNICTSEIRSARYVIPVMSDIRDIITGGYRRWIDSCKRDRSRDQKFARNQSEFSFPPAPSTPSLISSNHSLFVSLSLSRRFRISTHSWLFSLFTLSIGFCIAHPQASVHYRKYWISIMKYWMISDIRRAADIVRSQYVPAFLAVPTSASRQRGGGEGNCFACGSIFDN